MADGDFVEDEDRFGWYSGVVACKGCGGTHVAVWPGNCDEKTMECPYCGACCSLVVSLILNAAGQEKVARWPGGEG